MNTFNVILSGVAVFILGEIFVRFFLTPIHKLKEVKGEIASILLFHADNYGQAYLDLEAALGSKGEDRRVIEERIGSTRRWNNDLSKASDATRAIAAKLISAAEGIPFYNLVSTIKMIPPKVNILRAKKHLIRLSNSFDGGQAIINSAEYSDNVCKLLNIEFMNDE